MRDIFFVTGICFDFDPRNGWHTLARLFTVWQKCEGHELVKTTTLISGDSSSRRLTHVDAGSMTTLAITSRTSASFGPFFADRSLCPCASMSRISLWNCNPAFAACAFACLRGVVACVLEGARARLPCDTGTREAHETSQRRRHCTRGHCALTCQHSFVSCVRMSRFSLQPICPTFCGACFLVNVYTCWERS